jgi:putative inorganic carbon (HCO3(-)) transporter
VLVLLCANWLYYWRASGEALPSTPLNAALLLWNTALLVGMVVTADPDLTLPKATGLILGFATWRYFAVIIRGRKQLWLAVGIFVLTGLGMSALGMVSADWRHEIEFVRRLLPFLPPQLLTLPGAPDLGVHTNELAAVTLFLFPLGVASVLGWKLLPRGRKALAVSGALALASGLLLLWTQSRSGWMGALAAVMLLWLLWTILLPDGSRWRRPSLLALAAFTLVVLVAGIRLWPRLWAADNPEISAETAIGTFSTMAFRYEVWEWAIVALGDFPFTGTGLGTFRRVASRLYPIAYSTDIAHAHNIFLQVGLDTGLPGLIGYLALLAVSGVMVWKMAQRQDLFRPLALGLLATVVALHVYGLTDALAPGAKPAVLFWMVLGLLSGMWRLRMARAKRAAVRVQQTVHEPELELA